MKKGKRLKKLTLSFETLRRLDDRSLVFAGGGYDQSAPQCSLDSCADTCGCPPIPTGLQCTLFC